MSRIIVEVLDNFSEGFFLKYKDGISITFISLFIVDFLLLVVRRKKLSNPTGIV